MSWDDKDPIGPIIGGNIQPEGTPYVVVAEDGKILVSSNTRSEVFVNDGSGDVDMWRAAATAQKKSYTRCLTLIKEKGCDKQYLFLTSGGSFQANSSVNTVAVGLQDFTSW